MQANKFSQKFMAITNQKACRRNIWRKIPYDSIFGRN